MKKKIRLVAALMCATLGLIACDTDASVVNENLTRDADNFKVLRRVVFFNGITDEYLLTIEGYCSINHQGEQLEVICKNFGTYKKHFLGLSDNVTYFAEQVDNAKVSDDHYKVVFKPSTILPEIEIR